MIRLVIKLIRHASVTTTLAALVAGAAVAQLPEIRYGTEVPAEVKQMYERGVEFLCRTQLEDGSWQSGQAGGAATGMALMVLLADGEDPNFGKHKIEVQRAVRNLIQTQDARTGFIPSSMYHHGFAMLALAEAYGTVDDSTLWDAGGPKQRTIGEALELAVRCALTAQKINQFGAWRYSPSTNDADTSVSGAVLVGLLAARNAGIEIPDENIDRALAYFQSMTMANGQVGYSGGPSGGQSMNRSAIATLVFSIGKRKEWPQFDATAKYIAGELNHQEGGSYAQYFRYYMSQALFQSDFESWKRWKRENAAQLKNLQAEDGSFQASYGPAFGTAMSLLSLALDYRLLPIYER